MKRTTLFSTLAALLCSQASAAPNLQCSPFFDTDPFIVFNIDSPDSIDGSISYSVDGKRFNSIGSCAGDVIENHQVTDDSIQIQCGSANGSVGGDAVVLSLTNGERWTGSLHLPAGVIAEYPRGWTFELSCNSI